MNQNLRLLRDMPADLDAHASVAKSRQIYHELWGNSTNTSSLPILERHNIVQSFPKKWLTPNIQESLKLGDVEWLSSSGTSNERLQIFRPKNWRLEQLDYTFSNHSILAPIWRNGSTRISLTTAVCSKTVCFMDEPGPADRMVGRTLYINLSANPHTWNRDDCARMLAEINAAGSYFFDADPFYLAIFCQKIDYFGLSDSFENKPQALTLSYEKASINIRRFLEKRFDCPIFDLYGSTELGYLFIEEAAGTLTDISQKTCYEFLPLQEGEHNLYSLIVTTVKNPYMPLIRYHSGDCVSFTNHDMSLDHMLLCGRESDLYVNQQGTKISHGFVDQVIASYADSIFMYQFDEIRENRLQFMYSTKSQESLSELVASQLVEQLSELLQAEVKMQYLALISPGFSGKFNWLAKKA